LPPPPSLPADRGSSHPTHTCDLITSCCSRRSSRSPPAAARRRAAGTTGRAAARQGEADLSAYAWGGKISTRYFCKHCGIHCFARGHLAEVGGDYVSVNLNTLDDLDPRNVKVAHWDGRHDNWHAGTRDTPWPIVA
jgi:hypothetical protein